MRDRGLPLTGNKSLHILSEANHTMKLNGPGTDKILLMKPLLIGTFLSITKIHKHER